MLKRAMIGAAAAAVVAAAAFAAEEAPGYVPAGAVDAVQVVGPPPAAGTPAEAADIAAYRAAAAGVDTPRWRQAAEDDAIDMPVVLKRYACALNADLDPAKAPATARLLTRTLTDADVISRMAKTTYNRPRPFAADDPTTPLCVAVAPERRAKTSATYPSGHATVGAVWGLVLIQLAPDRAGPLAARTRVFVESRQVCRLHYPSDLRAGERLGGVIFARLQASPDYQADLAAARAEIAAAPKPVGCAS